MATLTKEEKNHQKFYVLINKTAPKIVRKYFDAAFPSPQLHQIINQKMNIIINLRKTKRINATQELVLRNIPGTSWPPWLPALPSGSSGI